MRKYLFTTVVSLFLISCGMEEIPTYKIELTVSPSEGGKLNVSPSLPMYPEGSTVTITPEPNEHWVFKQWEGDGSGSSTSFQLIMDSNKSIVGVFVKRDYPLTITITGEGTVEEKIITNPGGREYPHGTTVELTPKPKEGWVFESWGGDLTGTESPKTIKVDKGKNVTVKFKVQNFKLHPNGVTCLCPDSKPGDKGMINGVEYESVDNELLRKRRDEGKDMTRLCTTLVTDMSNLFKGVENTLEGINSFNQPIGNWDVSNVTNMKSMFQFSKFDQPIGFWDVSKVTDMSFMFNTRKVFDYSPYIERGFNQPIGNWNVSNVTNMSYMFSGGVQGSGDTPGYGWGQPNRFNQSIENWNVSNVTDMSFMFYSSLFNKPLEKWNVSKVKNMRGMFKECSFNQPIGSWNVGSVENMSNMFGGNGTLGIYNTFDQPIGDWNVSKVKDMEGMFSVNLPFNQPIGNWDVSNVTNMSSMFSSNRKFNQPIGTWNVRNVLNMDYMFLNSLFSQDLSKWCVSRIPSVPNSFSLSSEKQPKWGTCPD